MFIHSFVYGQTVWALLYGYLSPCFHFFHLYTYKWNCWIMPNFVFNFLRNCQTVSHRSYTILRSHQQCTRVLVVPHSCQHLLFSVGFFFWIVNLKKVKVKVASDSLWPNGLYNPWNSPGQNIGVGSLSLLQGIFPTQWSNSGLPHCRQILYQLSHQGSPRILEWAAYPFSRGSSRPRNWTRASRIAGGWYFMVVFICVLFLCV